MLATDRIAPPPARLNWQTAIVGAIKEETPRVRSLLVDVAGWRRHEAGQHVDVRLTAEDGYQAQRSYSIASAPDDPRIMLTIERIKDGEVSSYLAGEVKIGDQFEIRGPIGGHFVWKATQAEPLILVAGGSGIVPLMAMARHRFLTGSKVQTALLYSSRSIDDIIFRSELEELSTRDRSFRVTHTLTRERPAGWTGQSRRIDGKMLAQFGIPPSDTPQIYVCGPTALVEAVAKAMLALGHPAHRIRTERFGPTGG